MAADLFCLQSVPLLRGFGVLRIGALVGCVDRSVGGGEKIEGEPRAPRIDESYRNRSSRRE